MIGIIQVLRLLGSASITVYHSGIAGEHGFWAVDLFFVISGFILMYSTEPKEPVMLEEPVSAGRFLKKRLVRVVPLYWIMTLFMYLLISVMPSLSIMSEAKLPDLIRSLLFIPFENSRGYCAPILSLGWTLQYEILLYLLFAVSMSINFRKRGWICSGMILALVLAGTGANAAGIQMPVFLSFYTDSIMLEFILGIGAHEFWKRLNFVSRKEGMLTDIAEENAMKILSLAGIGVMVVLMARVENDYSIPRWIRLGLPAFILFAFSMMSLGREQFPRSTLKVASASYSIYLVEYFGMAAYKFLCPVVLNITGAESTSLPGWMIRFILLAGATAGILVVSLFTREWIEVRLGRKLLG